MRQKTVQWNEVKESARRAFDIWGSGSDYDWAEAAWKILTEAGLTGYSSNIERWTVLTQILALGTLCRDFCRVAWGEPCEYDSADLFEWAEAAELTPFRIGALVTHHELLDEMGNESSDEFDSDKEKYAALGSLIGKIRNELIVALNKNLGGDSALYLFLCRINMEEDLEAHKNENSGPDTQWTPIDPDVPMHAFGWVANGCSW